MKRRARHILAALAAVGLATSGCGFEATPSQFDDQSVDPDDSNDSTPAATGELGEGDGAGTIAGTWLKIHVASSCVLDQEQVSAAYYLVDIEPDRAGFVEHRRLCELDASPLLGFRPVASEETLASVQFPPVDLGMVSSLRTGGGYASSTTVGLWGIELDDPLDDSIPTDPDDERVVDADGDGNPGVTMDLEGSGCERYMGQRQIVKYQGAFEAPNDIRGTSVRTTETEVYGASGGACELAPDVVSNDDHSFFRMVRVDGRGGAIDAAGDDNADIACSDVAELLDELWEVREPNDEHCQ